MAPGEMPSQVTERGPFQPHAECAKKDELSPGQRRTRPTHPGTAWDGGSFPTPSLRDAFMISFIGMALKLKML